MMGKILTLIYSISHQFFKLGARWPHPVRIVSMCVCVCVSVPRLLITSGMVWRDMDSIQLVKQIL